MRKLRRMLYLSLLAILGTLLAIIFPEVTLLAMFGAATLLIIMRRLNFYKIAMMLKRFIQNTRRIYFENRLRFRTGVRAYRDTEIEHSSRISR
jgi:hypothetical protein